MGPPESNRGDNQLRGGIREESSRRHWGNSIRTVKIELVWLIIWYCARVMGMVVVPDELEDRIYLWRTHCTLLHCDAVETWSCELWWDWQLLSERFYRPHLYHDLHLFYRNLTISTIRLLTLISVMFPILLFFGGLFWPILYVAHSDHLFRRVL